jgi:hypothetical protein
MCQGFTWIIEPVIGIGNNATVGDHCVAANRHPADSGNQDPNVDQRTIGDLNSTTIPSSEPNEWLEHNSVPNRKPSLTQKLKRLAVQRHTREGSGPGEPPVQREAAPR